MSKNRLNRDSKSPSQRRTRIFANNPAIILDLGSTNIKRSNISKRSRYYTNTPVSERVNKSIRQSWVQVGKHMREATRKIAAKYGYRLRPGGKVVVRADPKLLQQLDQANIKYRVVEPKEKA